MQAKQPSIRQRLSLALLRRGTLYQLKPHADGSWTESVLHNFVVNDADGIDLNPLIIDALSNLFGTTTEGGTRNNGTVYELTP